MLAQVYAHSTNHQPVQDLQARRALLRDVIINGFIRVRSMHRSMVRWSRVEVEVDVDDEEGGVSMDSPGTGLDADAQQMHELFLGGLPHLSEVQDRHAEILDGVSNAVDGTKTFVRAAVPMGDFLAELGGAWSGSEAVVPLPSSLPGGVVIETLMEEGVQVARLISPERFGGMLRTFRLPLGKTVAGATWEDGVLTIRMSQPR